MPFGFIGAGNMGGALIEGALRQGVFGPGEVLVSERLKERAMELKERLKIRLSETGTRQLAEECDILFLCVKPQDSGQVLKELSQALRPGTLVVSIMAGISIGAMRRILGERVPIVRAMPNTPALVGEGITAICYTEDMPERPLGLVKGVFRSVGEVVEVEEALMDPVTAISGSGPGFVFRIMEAFLDQALEFGLPKEIAKALIAHTFSGAGRLALRSSKDLSELRQMVTSKGGTTEAGLKVFESSKTGDALRGVLKAASLRARELNLELQSKLSQ
jgi:pyrroline-5-carboxylate reductase